jgi:hypothetical protein
MKHYYIASIFFVFLFGIPLAGSSQNVGINTTGATPSTNAILDLNTGNSRNLGLILPHVALSSLTTFNPPIANAKTTSDTGLMVYNTNSTIGNGVGCYCWSGSKWIFAGGLKASTQASPPDPNGTSSIVPVMMGLAGSITPTNSGTILLVISGYAINTKSADSCKLQIVTGTGAAPANGAALSGTSRGTQLIIQPSANTTPFSLNVVITGLTINTAYWIDVSLASSKANGTASISYSSISAMEQ